MALKWNATPGSHLSISAWVLHSLSPLRLWPSKRAPTVGPSWPSCHSQVWHSGDHSPIRVISETALHTVIGSAAMSRVTDPVRSCPMAVTVAVAGAEVSPRAPLNLRRRRWRYRHWQGREPDRDRQGRSSVR